MQYVPGSFQAHDEALIARFVRSYPFGTLIVVNDEGQPCIAHIPMLLEGGISDGAVVGHVARANPLAKLLLERPRLATAIFHGPHAHVSPLAYASSPAVPTWNFMVVHLQGTAHAQDHAATVDHITQLSAAMEGEDGWKPERTPEGYIDNLASAIVAFRFQVQDVSAKLKLSQNRPDADRRGVVQWLQATDRAQAHELAEWMQQLDLA